MNYRILIDGRLISKKPTGISRYCVALIKDYISRYGEENIFVICNKNTPSTFKNNIITKYKPYNIIHFIFFSFWLNKYDFTHYHATVYSGVFFKKKKVTYLITIHDVFYRIVRDFFSENWVVNFCAIRYYDFIVRSSLRSADHIISVSDTTRSDLSIFFKKKSIVIPEGLNILNDENETNCEKKSFFLYVGNLRKQKNIQLLVDVFASLPDQQLIICGSKEHLKEKWLLCSNIDFIGNVSDQELANLYCQCRAFIYPSLYEGFGLPILEALSFNAIVFSSSGGSLKEFSNPNIYHFDPYDGQELKNLILNVNEISFNKMAARAMLEKYSWDNVLKDMGKILYNSAV